MVHVDEFDAAKAREWLANGKAVHDKEAQAFVVQTAIPFVREACDSGRDYVRLPLLTDKLAITVYNLLQAKGFEVESITSPKGAELVLNWGKERQ